MKNKYDYIIVGSGLFGSICAYELNKIGKKVLVLEKRPHIGGNIYTKNINGIEVHYYGAHIFHTSKKEVWDYINQFDEFNNYINSPIAKYKDEVYNLPFNMNTFSKIWKDAITPEKAMRHIEEEKNEMIYKEPTNLEEQAIKLVGKTIYEKLVKGYTEKQWGRECKKLPPFIIKRLPVRFTYDNNYFDDTYQGIPKHGYTKIIEKMLKGIEVKLNCDYLENKAKYDNMCKKVIYTGAIDRYYDYCYGKLEYRSLLFQHITYEEKNHQGNAVVNYTDNLEPYTRSIEHKHFYKQKDDKDFTVVSYEYPIEDEDDEPYYPINNIRNDKIYKQYYEKSLNDLKTVFGGRLGMYKYYNMDQIVEEALKLVKEILK